MCSNEFNTTQCTNLIIYEFQLETLAIVGQSSDHIMCNQDLFLMINLKKKKCLIFYERVAKV